VTVASDRIPQTGVEGTLRHQSSYLWRNRCIGLRGIVKSRQPPQACQIGKGIRVFFKTIPGDVELLQPLELRDVIGNAFNWFW
jgi:hypothetical protein